MNKGDIQMTREEFRFRVKQHRVREVARNKMMILLTVTFFIVLGSIIYGTIFASAHVGSEESDMQYKYYKSIIIEDGDSLWSIATAYADHHTSTKACMNEIIALNKLTSRTIHTGQHLVVPYYDTYAY